MQNFDFDIAIIGGGLIGLSLALALKESELNIVLIDPKKNAQITQTHQINNNINSEKSLALSYSSQQFLKKLNLWQEIQPFATPIEKIHISEEKRFGKAVLSCKDLDLETFGYVVPILLLTTVLHHKFNAYVKNKNANITFLDATKVIDVKQISNTQATHWALITDNKNHQNIRAKLLIAADGENSFVRQSLNLETEKFDYQQTAIVSTAKISRFHENTAYQRFTKKSVLAVMPLQYNRVGLIFTADTMHQDIICENFLNTMQNIMGYRLGKFSELGEIYRYPLKSLFVDPSSWPRHLVLLGNAANVLHPIAAQGLNLGLREVKLLANIFTHLQKDALENLDLFKNYFSHIKKDQLSNRRFTAHLIKIFSSHHTAFSYLRSAGLSVFDLITPAKRELCLRRMGL